MTVQCMGSIPVPITKFYRKHIYRRDVPVSCTVHLMNGSRIALEGTPNQDWTFVIIEDEFDSMPYRAEIEERLGPVSWFCPAPIARIRVELLPTFVFGFILFLMGK